MKHSEINFKILLDDENIPEQISWSATENPNEGIEETKSIFIGVWDNYNKGLMALPLWTKDMEVFDMKRFYIERRSYVLSRELKIFFQRSII